jgi:hypothetical protein
LQGKLSVQRAFAVSIAARSEPDPLSFVLSTTNVRAIVVVKVVVNACDSLAIPMNVPPSRMSGAFTVTLKPLRREAAGQTTCPPSRAHPPSLPTYVKPDGRLIVIVSPGPPNCW